MEVIHRVRRVVGKRQRENPIWGHPFFVDEVLDLPHHRERLSRPSAGEYPHQVRFGIDDRLLLRFRGDISFGDWIPRQVGVTVVAHCRTSVDTLTRVGLSPVGVAIAAAVVAIVAFATTLATVSVRARQMVILAYRIYWGGVRVRSAADWTGVTVLNCAFGAHPAVGSST